MRKKILVVGFVTAMSFLLAVFATPAVAQGETARRNLVQIGFNDLGGGGFNSDLWAHGDHAYIGTWGTFSSNPTHCPSTGTKVIDISDPANPVQVNTVPTRPRTLTNDVKVAHIETAFFRGDLLVVSNEECRPGGARGIELWDVTDPPNAEFLASFGPRLVFRGFFEWGGGVHNLYLYQKGDRAFALLAAAGAEQRQIENDFPATGELKIVEVTNPREPVQIASWGVKQDLGEPVGSILAGRVFGDDCRPVCRGESASIVLHDVWANQEGTVAYLSYWDAGLILLDISDPSQPIFLGRGTYDLGDEGNTHSAVPAQGGNLVIVGDEDFVADPWGFMRVFDTTDVRDPVEVGKFRTENTFGPPPDAGVYSVHNFFVRGTTVCAAWYSEGVRLLDISAPAAPREIAFFVPPDVPDPRRFFPAKASVWGVYVQGDLILASDINAGLYILTPIRIDIKPSSDLNPINPMSRGMIPVAILGSDTFDVLDVNAITLIFADGAAPVHKRGGHPQDVSNDGFTDLLSHYRTEEAGIAFGQDEACVTGEMRDGTPIDGCDSIVTVGSCGIGVELIFAVPPLMWLYRARRRNRA